MSAKDFSLQLDKAKLDTDEKISDAIALIGMFCLRGVVRKSPVHTGRFRSNWQVSKNVPRTTELALTKENQGVTISRGARTIETFDLKNDSQLIIQNNVPYANRLENGHSKQAPDGMVALTINEAAQRYRNILI
jgi:hypothetical protein